ncbi:unnamed protein product [Acanthoscelides obtectus]|uniref:Uncharacterized protein n=1 Tax=Acanthoscelides obtectus TaxID=200917 RepID=A0A9P0KDM9_ACAOB|nr:unnamed protein product [Acanthoscelides obtectus]CAK1680021.1 hypothetical protein AOBTE_LOCUS32493 [Acanthoscelides obtectus]
MCTARRYSSLCQGRRPIVAPSANGAVTTQQYPFVTGRGSPKFVVSYAAFLMAATFSTPSTPQAESVNQKHMHLPQLLSHKYTKTKIHISITELHVNSIK